MNADPVRITETAVGPRNCHFQLALNKEILAPHNSFVSLYSKAPLIWGARRNVYTKSAAIEEMKTRTRRKPFTKICFLHYHFDGNKLVCIKRFAAVAKITQSERFMEYRARHLKY